MTRDEDLEVNSKGESVLPQGPSCQPAFLHTPSMGDSKVSGMGYRVSESESMRVFITTVETQYSNTKV